MVADTVGPELKRELPWLKLDDGVWAVGLSLYLEDIDMLVVADLHLGYEQALEESGVFIPPVQFKFIASFILEALRETGSRRLLMLGDVKHEFGSALKQEWGETIELLSRLKEKGVEVSVVRGNHDNFLIPMLKRLEVPLYDPHLRLGRYLFMHGHKEPPLDAWGGVEYVVIGHEHPAVLLRDELGVSMKLKSFLVGAFGGTGLIVLPALSPLMPGTEVNAPRVRYLSPILERADVKSMRVYAADLESGIYDFGTVELLSKALFMSG
ncbi:MAG: metallophosphoesterase [Thermofilaceae archaeon]